MTRSIPGARLDGSIRSTQPTTKVSDLGPTTRTPSPPPPTWKFHTGGGGEHYLFRHPGHEIRNSAGQLGLGLDTRGDGGYIVAPPSLHISGRRYVVDVDGHPQQVALAPLPDWIDEHLRRAANGTGGGCQNWLTEVSRTV